MALNMKPPPGAKISHRAEHLLPHLGRRAKVQHVLRVDAPSPEHQPVTVLALQEKQDPCQPPNTAPGDHVDPGFDERFVESLQRATSVLEDLPVVFRWIQSHICW